MAERRDPTRQDDSGDLSGLSEALDTWRRWATGFPVSLEASSDVLEIFGSSPILDRSEVQALSMPLADWASDEVEIRLLRSHETDSLGPLSVGQPASTGTRARDRSGDRMAQSETPMP